MDYHDIIYAKEDGIATITLNRPDTRNALSPEMTESIYKVVADVS
ncbi:MAG: 1,4-dihydroxy-2-naphthoyl-CoA synthase, partial [Chloroflexi bacterium]|nr:1,4-dihydroxy-2-naphthoyl-CoA synthase [Chloroflexota bacterium]